MGRKPGNLPEQVTSFVGRREEAGSIRKLLSQSRLVTLTGPGGVGKSRLAVHVAQGHRRAFRDGVWLVELAELHDPTILIHAVAAALQLRDQTKREPEQALVDYLADKQMLLVVDNCEHLLSPTAHLVSAVLRGAPTVRIIATSREPLGVSGEHIWIVPPLSLPSVDTAAATLTNGPHHEALELFEQRAIAVSPGFSLKKNEQAVMRLCRLLDGIPLAIELAAVRLGAFGVQEILDRFEDHYQLLTSGFRDAPARQQTLSAAMDWSFNLCSGQERLLWARLSVFSGGFDLDAVVSVCAGDGLRQDEILECLAGLVNKSVVIREERGPVVRYRLLETIRQYGLDRLRLLEQETAMRCAHRDYFLDLAERAEQGWSSPEQAQWLARVRYDHANLRAAWNGFLSQPEESERALHMVATLWFYWVCGPTREGRHWLDRALASCPEPSRTRAKALWANGWVAACQGDLPSAKALTEESRETAESVGDDTARAYAMQCSGLALAFSGDAEAAAPLLDEALEHYRVHGEWNAMELVALAKRAWIALAFDDVDGAVTHLNRCQDMCQARNERWAQSWAQWVLGMAAWATGDLTLANSRIQKCLRSKRDLDDWFGIPFSIECLAWIAAKEANAKRAAHLLGINQTLWQPIGAPLFNVTAYLDWHGQCELEARRRLSDRAFDTAFRTGSRLATDDAVAYALGEQTMSPPQNDTIASQLTQRERDVASLVALGLSNQEIANRLVISRRTVDTHVDHILNKLGFTSRVQVASEMAELRYSAEHREGGHIQ